jgi:hypothetical protein
MRFIAPKDASGINIGGEEFNVVDGMIEVPDDFTASGVGALVGHGYCMAPATAADVAAEAAAEAARTQAALDAAEAVAAAKAGK